MKPTISELMKKMPESWRYRWCDGGMCGCMGCANKSGGLAQNQVSREEWERWVIENPDQSAEEKRQHQMVLQQQMRQLKEDFITAFNLK